MTILSVLHAHWETKEDMKASKEQEKYRSISSEIDSIGSVN